MSFSHFLIWLLAFLVLICMSCLYILEINPLSVVSLVVTASKCGVKSFHIAKKVSVAVTFLLIFYFLLKYIYITVKILYAVTK